MFSIFFNVLYLTPWQYSLTSTQVKAALYPPQVTGTQYNNIWQKILRVFVIEKFLNTVIVFSSSHLYRHCVSLIQPVSNILIREWKETLTKTCFVPRYDLVFDPELGACTWPDLSLDPACRDYTGNTGNPDQPAQCSAYLN